MKSGTAVLYLGGKLNSTSTFCIYWGKWVKFSIKNLYVMLLKNLSFVEFGTVKYIPYSRE